MNSPRLRFEYEWEAADGVRSEELSATWARLEVWVGATCVSAVEDAASRSFRRSIYCPLYPLAEWIAFNWWAIDSFVRPALFPPRTWSYTRMPGRGGQELQSIRRLNMRSAGDGFLWPNLSIVPEGELAHLAWFADHTFASAAPVRFTETGEALLERDAVMATLARLVESVLTRLDEVGVRTSSLSEEWEAVTALDADERAFCRAAARLGLDPYDVDDGLGSELEAASERLDPAMFDEFLGVADPARFRSSLQWIDAAADELQGLSGPATRTLAELQHGIGGAELASGAPPWERGWSQARIVRGALGAGSSAELHLDELVQISKRVAPDTSLEALGGRSSAGASGLILGRDQHERSARFAAARSLWHVLFEPKRTQFLLTAAHTERQRIERAFAAELLAPAEGIESMLNATGIVYQDELDKVATHFNVSTQLVRHQARNQLALDVIE